MSSYEERASRRLHRIARLASQLSDNDVPNLVNAIVDHSLETLGELHEGPIIDATMRVLSRAALALSTFSRSAVARRLTLERTGSISPETIAVVQHLILDRPLMNALTHIASIQQPRTIDKGASNAHHDFDRPSQEGEPTRPNGRENQDGDNA